MDVPAVARLHASSEEPSASVVNAFVSQSLTGWRAAAPGVQTIDIEFREARDLTRIRLVFEPEHDGTHEFTLSWRSENSLIEIVRQQFTFSRDGATREVEEYEVDLHKVDALRIRIIPDISGTAQRASLRECRLG
jgi:hypothetical protein